MDPEDPHRRLRRILSWAEFLSLLTASVFGGMALGSLVNAPSTFTTAPGVTIQPGVTLVYWPLGGPNQYANVTFTSGLNVTTNATWNPAVGPGWCFDGICLNVSKTPRTYPSAWVNVSRWTPTTLATQGVAAAFTATAPAGSTVWFNFTGLQALQPYALQADGAKPVQAQNASSQGRANFTWNTWSQHSFVVVFLPQTSGGGGGALPRLAAAFDSLVNGMTVTFIDRSTNGSAPITSWSWLFGDGQGSSDPNPTHTYNGTSMPPWKSVPVQLRVCDSAGTCSNTTKSVWLFNWPILMILVVIVSIGFAIVAGVVIRIVRR